MPVLQSSSPFGTTLSIFSSGSLYLGAVLHLPWQVDVADIEQAPVYIVVERLFAAHQFIFIVQVDLVDALPLLYK